MTMSTNKKENHPFTMLNKVIKKNLPVDIIKLNQQEEQGGSIQTLSLK